VVGQRGAYPASPGVKIDSSEEREVRARGGGAETVWAWIRSAGLISTRLGRGQQPRGSGRWCARHFLPGAPVRRRGEGAHLRSIAGLTVCVREAARSARPRDRVGYPARCPLSHGRRVGLPYDRETKTLLWERWSEGSPSGRRRRMRAGRRAGKLLAGDSQPGMLVVVGRAFWLWLTTRPRAPPAGGCTSPSSGTTVCAARCPSPPGFPCC